jgi:hypothetical protein
MLSYNVKKFKIENIKTGRMILADFNLLEKGLT